MEVEAQLEVVEKTESLPEGEVRGWEAGEVGRCFEWKVVAR